jgi:signal transduction histidine kinase
MARSLPLDGIESRTILAGYAAVVIPVGVFVTFWSTLWVGGPLNGQPWGIESLVRVGGTLIAGAGFSALALSRISDPSERRQGLGWFAIGHTLVALIAWTQVHAIWANATPVAARWGFTGLLVAWAWLFGGWFRHGGDVMPLGPYLLRLFRGQPAPVHIVLRSAYDLQMRQAGAQEERNRLARDLHDSVKQQIFAIQTAAATAEVRLSTDLEGARLAIAQVRDAGRDSMAEMDAMLDQLRATPLEANGLTEALKRQCEALRLRTGSEVVCEVGPLPPVDSLPPGIHLAIFRAAQEALSNIARHARPSHVVVKVLRSGSRITLTVADDGSGFEPGAAIAGMGIRNVRARAEELNGEAHVSSEPGKGTTVFVTLPYPDGEPRPYLRKGLVQLFLMSLLLFFIVRSDRDWRRSQFMILILVPAALDVVRNFVAWRRARHLRETTA